MPLWFPSYSTNQGAVIPLSEWKLWYPIWSETQSSFCNASPGKFSSRQSPSFRDTPSDYSFTWCLPSFSDECFSPTPTFEVTTKEKVMNQELAEDIVSLVECLNPTPLWYWVCRMNYTPLKSREVSGSGDTFTRHSLLMPTSLLGMVTGDFTSALC